jgi:septum formation protein
MPRNTPERLNGVQVTLASSSRHRAAQLRQLVIDFDTVSPDVDETAGDSESVNDLVTRLGLAKAQAALVQAPGRVLIASDQSAAFTLGDSLQRLGKPGTPEAAIRQLHDLSGKEVTFLTSLVVLDDRSGGTPTPTVDVDVTQVRLRHLSTAEIERYVARDDVLDCAGAFRVESLGIALFEHIRSDDPTALVGLPLIRLAARLRDCGLAIP